MRASRLWCSCVLVLAASLAGKGSTSGTTERDSAGVTIVENLVSQTATPTWHLSDTPTVEIGLVEGAEPYLLHRVTASYVLDDGRIVVANSGTAELRFFDAQGTYLGATEGRGQGPGELRGIGQVVRLPGDTLINVDPGEGRLDRFDSEGRYIDRSRFSFRHLFNRPFFAENAELLPDGSLLILLFESERETPTGLSRARLGRIRLNLATTEQDTIGWFGAAENYTIEVGGRRLPGSAPFGRHTVITWSDRYIYVGDTDRYEVSCYTIDGSLVRLIRRDADPVPVTDQDIADHRALYREFMKQNPDRAELLRRWLDAVPYPATKPSFTRLMTDRLENLWVAEPRPAAEDAVPWSVFTAEGQFLSRIGLPQNFTPKDIGPNYVLGVWRDELEVEFVRRHEIVRSKGKE
ncbi:MAG: hypothetical protein HKM89_05590 [Gemmatimonadales bacterium]|nr:hypothetical protein [Gemmatimonadales bacterium]